MKQQPDKIFSEKLSGYRRPAPANTWSRIEQNLDKKNNKGLWLKIAAAVALLITAGIFVLIQQRNEKPPYTTVVPEKLQPRKTPQKEIAAEKKQSPESTPNNVKEEIESAHKPRVGGIKKLQPTTIQPLVEQVEENPVAFEDQAGRPIYTVTNEGTSEEEAIVITQETVVVNQESQPAVVLIYTAEEVNEKYLDKKSLARATEEAKKQSTLRKLWEKANDLKRNQDPIGELRQKKNEILALNFRSDKQRSQNR